MRKFFIPLLMAGAMMPAAAMAQDRDHQRGRGDEQRAERRAERAETNAADDRPQRQERAERPQREERAAQPQREQMVVRERSAEAPQQPRFERRERRADQVQQVQQVQQVEQVRQLEPARQVQSDQVRVRREGGFLGGIRETARQQQVLQAQPPTRDGRRDGYRDGSRDGRRDGYRDGNHDRNQRWSSHWRGDNRYDWRRHRDHNRSIFRLGNYYDPYGWGYRRFSIGFNIGSGYYGSNYWLDDPWMYRLPPAYGPYRWVRYYDDALLVNIYSGQVVDVINNFFW